MKASKSTGLTTRPDSRLGANAQPTEHAPGLLIEGDTCWRRAHAARAAVLIDAARYFEALRASLLAAEHTIFILGWELPSHTRLQGHLRPTDGAPVELGKLLRWLLKRRKGLTIRILLWNHPVLYSVRRELFPRLIFGRHRPERARRPLSARRGSAERDETWQFCPSRYAPSPGAPAPWRYLGASPRTPTGCSTCRRFR